jgi:hypothetical protein
MSVSIVDRERSIISETFAKCETKLLLLSSLRLLMCVYAWSAHVSQIDHAGWIDIVVGAYEEYAEVLFAVENKL